MTKNILLCGNDLLMEAIIQHNILQDKDIKFTWYQQEVEFPALVQEILSAAVMAKNFSLTATNTPKWEDIDLLLIGKPISRIEKDPEENAALRAEIHWTQLIINQAMANNFSGKVCFLSEHSEEQVFSALHFSGLPVSSIFGLGTLPVTLLAENLLSSILKIDVTQVHVDVLGTAHQTVPAWSRGLIAGAPLLSLVAQENSLFKQDYLTEIDDKLQKVTAKSLLPAVLGSLDRLFDALFSRFGLVMPLTHQIKFGDQTIALSEPVLLSNQGVSSMVGIKLSENEKQQLAAIKGDVLASIQGLTGGK